MGGPTQARLFHVGELTARVGIATELLVRHGKVERRDPLVRVEQQRAAQGVRRRARVVVHMKGDTAHEVGLGGKGVPLQNERAEGDRLGGIGQPR